MNKRAILALLAVSGLMACLSFAQEATQLEGAALGNTQAGWRWCSKCDGMHNISGGIGACPAGGTHSTSGSGPYAIAKSDPKMPAPVWRCCSKCKGLFHPWPDNGVCPTGGTHDGTGSVDYHMFFGLDAEIGQRGWRECSVCTGLFYAGSAPYGTCPAGGQHKVGNSDYMPFREADLPILWGWVTDSTGKAVSNAQVQATRSGTTVKTKTKADGTFSFTKIGLGKTTVKATKKKVGEATATVRIKTGDAKSVYGLKLEK